MPSFRYRYLGIVGLAGRAFRVRCAASLVCCPSQKTWLWLVPAVDERRGLHRCDRLSSLAHPWVAPWARKMLSDDSIILLVDASHSWDGHGGGYVVCFPACLLHAPLRVECANKCTGLEGMEGLVLLRERKLVKEAGENAAPQNDERLAGCSRHAAGSTKQRIEAWTISSLHCYHRFLVYGV